MAPLPGAGSPFLRATDAERIATSPYHPWGVPVFAHAHGPRRHCGCSHRLRTVSRTELAPRIGTGLPDLAAADSPRPVVRRRRQRRRLHRLRQPGGDRMPADGLAEAGGSYRRGKVNDCTARPLDHVGTAPCRRPGGHPSTGQGCRCGVCGQRHFRSGPDALPASVPAFARHTAGQHAPCDVVGLAARAERLPAGVLASDGDDGGARIRPEGCVGLLQARHRPKPS